MGIGYLLTESLKGLSVIRHVLYLTHKLVVMVSSRFVLLLFSEAVVLPQKFRPQMAGEAERRQKEGVKIK